MRDINEIRAIEFPISC